MPEQLSCAKYTAGLCASCSMIELPYAQQLLLKEQQVAALLSDFWADHAAAEWLPPVVSKISGFRNKAKFVVAGKAGNLQLGISGAQGNVDLTDCPVQDIRVNRAGQKLKTFLNGLQLAGYNVAQKRGELKFVHVTVAPSGSLLVRFVVRSLTAAEKIAAQSATLRELLPEIETATVNLLPEHKAVLEGETEYVLWGGGLSVETGQVRLQLLPRSFFQTNTEVAIELYRQARIWADEIRPASVLDLYCGVGGFALHIAEPKTVLEKRRVVGVELNEYAVRAAKRSARQQQLAATFIAADATEYVRTSGFVPELLIVNPPRRGIGAELCEWIGAARPRHVIYSSCNPVTLAADLARIATYRVVSARLFDMFAHTKHLEVAVLLARD